MKKASLMVAESCFIQLGTSMRATSLMDRLMGEAEY